MALPPTFLILNQLNDALFEPLYFMQKTSQRFSETHAANLAAFVQTLEKSRFWHVLPDSANAVDSAIDKATGILDAETGLLYPSAASLQAFLQQHPFIHLRTGQAPTPIATLHTTTGLLWSNATSDQQYDLAAGKKRLAQAKFAGLDGWQVPTKDQLWGFATANNNPYRQGQAYRLKTCTGEVTWGWLTTAGYCDTDNGHWHPTSTTSPAYLFACHSVWHGASITSSLLQLVIEGYLLTPNHPAFTPNTGWQHFSPEQRLAALIDQGSYLCSVDLDSLILKPQQFWLEASVMALDYQPCRLPKLDQAQLTDPEKGLWEFWGESPDFLKRFGWVARDPIRDVRRQAVAIDFGTSSTVVAMGTAQGGRELLRIGVRDFYQTVTPADFENPTVLECLDFSAFESAWTGSSYRPPLDWAWMLAAHEAQSHFRDNPGDTEILSSILPRLKQWALRSAQSRVRLTDRQGREVELVAHRECNPVRGQALVLDPNYVFDPIELYAWYLGMAINWRGRGIFLRYYLSFPVKYPREVKNNILSSFRRGLQRSLPQSLITHHPEVLHKIQVEGLASEPAAYAAAAMHHLQLEPSEAGIPYAVFDFGGGTTDFDFGLLRWATQAEEDQGYEQVFEHLASDGDTYLGGENLLEHLVYASFQHNLEVLREKRIQFTKPLDAASFVGSEAFLAPTQAAQTNSIMLAAKLRPFLEGDASERQNFVGQVKLELIDANGKKQSCELVFDTDALDSLLATRIRDGVLAFLSSLARLLPELPSNTPIHILLAGNGSRSRHVTACFATDGELWPELLRQAFGATPPQMTVHLPLPMDAANPHAPTTKTGVALGLLHLAPGENTLLLDHVHQAHDGQAPFAWFIGRLRRQQFNMVLAPGANYGEWREIGPLQQDTFHLYATASPRAHGSASLALGDPELKKYPLFFPAAPVGARLFAKPIDPHTLEVAAALELAALGESLDTQTLSLS